jgi:hypothetical protein
MTEKNPRGAGRKPKPEGEKLKARDVYFSDAEWQQIQMLGGSKFVREMVKVFLKGKAKDG